MGKADFSCEVDANLQAHDGFSDTLRVHCYWKCNGWRYNMGPVSAWVTCNGREVCVASNININFQNNQGRYELGFADFGLPRNQSGYYVKYTARLRSDSSYISGERRSGEGSHGVGALASHSVTYNANGGSGAPGGQTKWYGTVLKLSTGRPNRTGHSFRGWSTSPGGGIEYQPGDNYGNDTNVTLYAVWKADTYSVTYNANGGVGAPGAQVKTYGQNLVLSSVRPTRQNYNFTGWATSPNGGVAYQPGSTYTGNGRLDLYAKWSIAYIRPRITNFSVFRCLSNGTQSESGTFLKYKFDWQTDRAVTSIQVGYKVQGGSYTWIKVSASGTSGKVDFVTGGGSISIESTYEGVGWVQDSGGATYSPYLSIGTVKYPIDVKKGGKGVAIGKVAEEDDLFDIGMSTTRANRINCNIINANKIEKIGEILYNNASGTNGTVTLSADSKIFKYIEVYYTSHGRSSCTKFREKNTSFTAEIKFWTGGTINDRGKFRNMTAHYSVADNIISTNYRVFVDQDGYSQIYDHSIAITKVVGYY